MPCWYYDKVELRHTPSIRDGLTLETERRYRREGARFIMSCGTNMGLGHNTLATGIVYFHRFYMFHSFKSFPRYVTACCCLLLAGKVEETPKKCWDIINIARQLLTDNHFYSFGKEPKEEVVTLERILLQTIKFDLQVEHPYTYLLKYAKCLKGDQQKLQKMVQMAWNFVNDSLSTVLCLQWEPEIIAVALIYLASKLSKFTVSDWKGRQSNHTRWWDMFVQDMTMDILEDICHQVLDLYQNNPKDTSESNSPPQKPPSRIESPSLTRIGCGGGVVVGSSQPIPTIGCYKNNNLGSFCGNVMNNTGSNSKPSTSVIATTIFSGDSGSNNGSSTIGNNSGASRKSGCVPLLASTVSSFTGANKDGSNTASGGHFSQQHRSGTSSHSTHLYSATTPNAAGNSIGSHSSLSHLQSLYSQVTLPPPPPPPPSSKYPSHPSLSSTGRNTSPIPSGTITSNAQPPLPAQPAPPFNATNFYNHPHYPNAVPPIPMAPLPRLPPPPPPPTLKSGLSTANTAIIPSITSGHHKQIPLPSNSFPSTSGGSSSSGSSRQRH